MLTEKTPGDNSRELREIREALGLSLEDIFKQTRVRIVYLQAIENKEFHLLPVPVYAKNFIKIYSRAIGIDGEPIIKNYEDYLNSRKETRTLPLTNVSKTKLFLERITGNKTYLSIAFVLIVVIVVSWVISKQYESSSDIINSTGGVIDAVQHNKEQNVNPSIDANITVNQQTKASPPSELNEISKQLPVNKQNNFSKVEPIKKQVSLPVQNIQTVANGTSFLVIKATEETWMRIKADQNQSFQVLLKPGEKIERKGESFDIDIGNAGGIKIQFKGKDIKNIGKTGEVVHLRLP